MTLPTLLVRGKLSDLVTETEVAEFLEMVPHARYVDVANAAHMIAGDRNDVFSDAVVVPRILNRAFLTCHVTRVGERGMTTSQDLHERIEGQNLATRFLANVARNGDVEVIRWKEPTASGVMTMNELSEITARLVPGSGRSASAGATGSC